MDEGVGCHETRLTATSDLPGDRSGGLRSPDMRHPAIDLVRLPSIDVHAVAALLNEPRNARHMPLAGESFTIASAAAWVSDKDGQWEANGYGP